MFRCERNGCPRVIVADCFLLTAVTAVVALIGCSPGPADRPADIGSGSDPLEDAGSNSNEFGGAIRFEESAAEIGIRFLHTAGDPNDYFMPRSLGSGLAIFDANRDGLMDVYALQNAGPDSGFSNQLFIQNDDGTFVDSGKGSGLDVASFCMGVAVGDVNNDGWPDVWITEYLGSRLFLNQKDLTFRDVTKEAGISNPEWGASASFLDYNRDGLLDALVVNYVDYADSKSCWGKNGKPEFCAPEGFQPSITRLFENRSSESSGVLFKDVTVESGLIRHPGPGMTALCLDFNGDDWCDILIADDGKPNRLFMNLKDGTFKEEANLRGIAFDGMGRTRANMGIAHGDVDGDGRFDVFMTHLQSEFHTLWQQSMPGVFTDKTGFFQLNRLDWRGTAFGAAMSDLDLDGDQDLCLVNGDIKRNENVQGPFPDELSVFWQPYAQKSQVFSNTGNGVYVDVSADVGSLSQPATVGRALACGDLNNDGLPDLVINSIGSSLRVLLNQTRTDNHWILLTLIEPAHGDRHAVGAKVELTAGGRIYRRWHNPSYSYLASNDPRVHFGLGSATRIDHIQVTWPDGVTEGFPGCGVNQNLVLSKGRSGP